MLGDFTWDARQFKFWRNPRLKLKIYFMLVEDAVIIIDEGLVDDLAE